MPIKFIIITSALLSEQIIPFWHYHLFALIGSIYVTKTPNDVAKVITASDTKAALNSLIYIL